MANIKEFRLTADVPFNWLQEDERDGGLPDAEIAAIGAFLLSPVTGVDYDFESIGYEPNEHGGLTAMYRLTINGTEALSWPFLERIAKALAHVGRLHIAEARDVQWADEIGRWEHIVDATLLTGQAETA